MGRISEIMKCKTNITARDHEKEYYYQNALKYDSSLCEEYEMYEKDQHRLRNEAIRSTFDQYPDKHPNMSTVMTYISEKGGVELIVETE